MNEEVDTLEYFIAGVPPYALFSLDFKELINMVESVKTYDHMISNKVPEVSYIGLVAYFEAYCKNLFAACINIYPQILYRFCERRGNISVSVADVLRMTDKINYRIGALIAENFDFGSPKGLNSLFIDLLGITPLSKKEIEKYSKILNDRNLLVHHGGIYTYRYHGQSYKNQEISDLVHWNSLTISGERYMSDATYINGVAVKMTKACHEALSKLLAEGNIVLTKTQQDALNYLLWID